MDIRLLDGAKEDLRNGWFFYERQSPGLGDRFLDAIEAEVQTLALYAGIHLKVEGFYRMLIRRFPFALYYLIDDDTIAIYAILDCRRDPNGLRKRLGGSEDLT
jgi:plasmid stabilization system protein ParE